MGPVLALLAIGIPLILLSIKLACDNRTEQKKIKGMSDDDIVERIKSENEFERDYIEKLKKTVNKMKLEDDYENLKEKQERRAQKRAKTKSKEEPKKDSKTDTKPKEEPKKNPEEDKKKKTTSLAAYPYNYPRFF